MKTLTAFVIAAAIALCLFVQLRSPGRAAEGSGPALGHMVFFELEEGTKEAKEKLVRACHEHLSGHEGTIHYSAGTIAEDLKRDVNDLGFHVALHLVFESKAAHDKYQDHPRHTKFIEESRDSWKRVRVFDSYLSGRPEEGKKGEGKAAGAKAKR
jgi:hypothetical protein